MQNDFGNSNYYFYMERCIVGKNGVNVAAGIIVVMSMMGNCCRNPKCTCEDKEKEEKK